MVVRLVATVALLIFAAAVSALLLKPPLATTSLSATWNDYYEDLAACVDFDDDTVFPGDCTEHDYEYACTSVYTKPHTGFYRLCASACTRSNTSSYGMVCAWEAVARLPEACDGTFSPTEPLNSSNMPNDHAVAPDLTNCDEHAFCYSCARGNAYCRAVAFYYGGVDGGSSFVIGGAMAAYYALDDDLSFWCSDSTLAAVAAGNFHALVR